MRVGKMVDEFEMVSKKNNLDRGLMLMLNGDGKVKSRNCFESGSACMKAWLQL